MLSLWGGGSVTRFQGSEGGVTLEGKASTAAAGMETGTGFGNIGVQVTRSTGEGAYDSTDGQGAITSYLTGLYPYFHVVRPERFMTWGVAGYGRGKIRIEPQRGPASESEISMAMAALGTRGEMGTIDGLTLAIETDGLIVQTRSKSSEGLDATDGQATRLRIGLAGTQVIRISETATVAPSFRLGFRRDGGDAETGTGIDVQGGIAVQETRSGISAEIGGRAHVARGEERLRSWSLSGSLQLDPDPASEQGLEFSLTSFRGTTFSGIGTGLDHISGVDGSAGDWLGSPESSIEAEMGYGMPFADGTVMARPSLGIAWEGAAQTLRTGLAIRLEQSRNVSLEIGIEAYQTTEPMGTEEGVAGTLHLRW